MNNACQQAEEQAVIAGKYLTFSLAAERYGLQILKVQEIIKVPHITLVPKSPDYIKGVINLRGKIIPVLDLRLKFGMASREYDQRTCIIVINLISGDRPISVGIIVDSVLDVINFLPSEIELPPNYGSYLNTQFIIGMGKRDEHLNILIEIEKVVTEQDTSGLDGMTEQSTQQAAH